MSDFPAVGVTATRYGLTAPQVLTAADRLMAWRDQRGARELHHGDCIGGDEEVAEIARDLGYRLVCHPPASRRFRAFVKSDEYRPPAPYLTRNHNVVDTVHGMLALPSGDVEQLRSGTWATVRYARKVGRPLVVVSPSGDVIECRGVAA